MKILFCSYTFAPKVGGTEIVGRLLAQEFQNAGHEVRIITESSGDAAENVIRQASFRRLLNLVRWADIVFHNNISLRYAWPLIFHRKPWKVAHHTWLRKPGGSKGMAEFVKTACIRHAANIGISRAISSELPAGARTVPDPYDADVFHVQREIDRCRELIFVGRLVSDKGVDVLLNALAYLKEREVIPKLTVVGDGPERIRLQQQTQALSIVDQVSFEGERPATEVATLLNQHHILVVPSRWKEPFGVVALEGIACGCVVIGTRGGGLPNAIGPCGITVPNGETRPLANTIAGMLQNADLIAHYRSQAEAHLKEHHPAEIAQKYLDAFEQAGSRK